MPQPLYHPGERAPNISRRHGEPHNWSGKKKYLVPDGKEP